MPSLVTFLSSSRKATTASPVVPTSDSKSHASVSTLEVTYQNPLDARAPGYSTYSQDANSPPPPYHYELAGVEEDLIPAAPSHLSQREALVLLEKEAKARRLQERRRQLLERDRLVAAQLKAFRL